MPIDVKAIIPWPIDPELLEFCEEQANVEHINPVDVLERALRREKARLDPDAIPIDARTKRPGVRGSKARMDPGMLTGPELRDAAGVPDHIFTKLCIDGIIRPDQKGGGRGHPNGWAHGQVRAVKAVAAIRRLAPNLSAERQRDVANLVAKADEGLFRPGRFLVISEKGVHLVTVNNLAAQIEQAGGVAMVMHAAELVDDHRPRIAI